MRQGGRYLSHEREFVRQRGRPPIDTTSAVNCSASMCEYHFLLPLRYKALSLGEHFTNHSCNGVVLPSASDKRSVGRPHLLFEDKTWLPKSSVLRLSCLLHDVTNVSARRYVLCSSPPFLLRRRRRAPSSSGLLRGQWYRLRRHH